MNKPARGVIRGMRKGQRKLLVFLGLSLLGTLALAAPPEGPAPLGETPVHMTVEITWSFAGEPVSSADALAVELGMSEGKVAEAVAWPPAQRSRGAWEPSRKADGLWRLGSDSVGRVRARIEAPLGAVFLFRAGGQELRFPLTAVLEGRQHTPPQTPVEIAIERVPWDSLTLQTTPTPGEELIDGTCAPGARLNVATGVNVLTPEPSEMNVHCTADLRPLRGGDTVWHSDRSEIVPTNRLEIPARAWNLNMPRTEGTYVLEVRATWEPVIPSREGTVFSRVFRRRRSSPAAGGSATRRMTLVVLKPEAKREHATDRPKAGQEVDTIDLTRPGARRLVASGRAPLAAQGRSGWDVPDAALVEPNRGPLNTTRSVVRGLIAGSPTEIANLGAPDNSGLAWTALGLKVPRPGRPHRLTVKVTAGHPEALGVALLEPNGPGKPARVALDVCASGLPILPDGKPETFSWLVWPDVSEPVVVLVNRCANASVQLGSVTLTELGETLPAAAVSEPEARPRSLGLFLPGPSALERFGPLGDETTPGDPLGMAQHLASYLTYCGASSVVVPEELSDRPQRQGLHGQAAEDALGPDRLDLLLRLLGRLNVNAWLELSLNGPLPGLPNPGSAEALNRGLVRIDGRGQADGTDYHLLHPDVREAVKQRVVDVLKPRRGQKNISGALIRLGPGSTLLGNPGTGLDDSTYERFVREMFDAMTARTAPGLNDQDPNRFAQRASFVMASARMPWMSWRARGVAALYNELAEAVRDVSPSLSLAVATPGLDHGPAGDEARRVDLAGLAPSEAWRAVGLDLDAWSTGTNAPLVLRGLTLSADDLSHDLATSPELDAKVASRSDRGLFLALADDEADPRAANDRPAASPRLLASPLSDGQVGTEPLGHALSALDARCVFLSLAAVAGREEPLRRFAEVFRALPAAPPGTPLSDRHSSGVAVRSTRAGQSTYLALSNDTPYPILLETVLTGNGSAPVDDLGRNLRLTPKTERGESHVVLEMPPFGVAAIRIGATEVRVTNIASYPSEVVKASMLAQYNVLSNLLNRLNESSEGTAGPTNSGFEPGGGNARVVPSSLKSAPITPVGWQLAEAMGMPGANAIEIDPSQVHSGQGSLRFTATVPPASVVSEPFAPRAQSSLTVTAWFRSNQPDAKLRLWIEGEAAGQPFVRRSDLTLQPEWRAQAVRASNLPAGGLDTLRLRFETLVAGQLWIDELSVTGESLSDAERQNARRALLAAMVAHRENRYGDFARLASSHWAKRPALLWGDPAALARSGGPTALPSDRRLR